MTSVFDFDDALNAAYTAKTAGKTLVTAKHEVLTKTGEFLFLAHSDKEFALRCQMIEKDIESAAHRKMAAVSDSKFKLVRALHEEWKIRHANCGNCKIAAGEWSAMGRATGEGMKCEGCKTVAPKGGLGHNTGLCLNCESKADMKTPGHDYQGNTFNDRPTASKGDQKNCAECGKPATEHDVRGYLELCSDCAGKKKKSSKVQEKLATLTDRITPKSAMATNFYPGYRNRDDVTIRSTRLPENEESALHGFAQSLPTVRDNPESGQNLREGHFVLLHKPHADDPQHPGEYTLGRVMGAEAGGAPDLSDSSCTGNTHDGFTLQGSNKCTHEGEPHARHFSINEIKINRAVPHPAGGIMPVPDLDEATTREGLVQVPARHIRALPEHMNSKIHEFLDYHARGNGYAVQHPETGEMVHPIHVPDENQGSWVNFFRLPQGQKQGGYHGVGQNIGRLLMRSTALFGHRDDKPGGARAGENDPYQLETSPSDWSGGNRDKNSNWGRPLDGQGGRGGSGSLLPAIHLARTRKISGNPTEASEGITAAGTPYQGQHEQLRVGSYGTEHSAPTVQVLQQHNPQEVPSQDGAAREEKFAQLLSSFRPARAKSTTSPGKTKSEVAMPTIDDIFTQFD